MKDLIMHTLDLRSGTVEEKRKEIRDYFLNTWKIDEKLYTVLASDDIFYHRGDPLRHIILFYLGHTAAFFINKFMISKIISERVNPEFESIFAIGVDEMSWDDLNNAHYNWPTVKETRKYRDEVKKVVLDVIDNAKFDMPITWESPMWIVMMGIEHERIHLETSSVLIRQLPLNEVIAGRFGKICTESGEAPKNEMISVTGAELKLGKPMEHPFYGWDNEYGKYTEKVADFKASKYLISNGEYLQFILSGGYHSQELWTEEGWSWKEFKQAEMPLFWTKSGKEYKLRLVAEEIPMPWNWPVEVNYLEAKAYANWKTMTTGKTYRLPTEAEWYRLFEVAGLKDVMDWKKAPGNINLEYFASSCPVDKFKQGDFYDIIGNVWQWTETPITGFAGFKVHPAYDDFSTPTFDGQHNLIKGGSWISTGNEATYHSRYAFRRHFYQHAGIRLVESETPLKIQNNEYETDEEVTLACEKDWFDGFSNTKNFSKELSKIILQNVKDAKNKHIADFNADTGRLAFELAQNFKKVTAIDFSARFVKMSIQLQDNGFMRYIMKDQGDLQLFRDVELSKFGLEKSSKDIKFFQGDVNNLKPHYSGYDVIVLPDILQDVAKPRQFLKSLKERLNPDGILAIASDYDWNLKKTEHKYWLGGYKKDGEPVTPFDALKKTLAESFELMNEPVELELTLPQNSRTKILKQMQVTFWKMS